MRKLWSTLSLMLISAILYGQHQRLYVQNYQLRAKLDVMQNKLAVYNFSNGVSATLANDELQVNYRLPATQSNEFYNVYFKVTLDGQDITPPAHFLTGNFGENQQVAVGEEVRSITWFGLAEYNQSLKGKLRLQVKVEYFEAKKFAYDVTCFNPPEFGFRQQWPHYAASVIGIVSVRQGLKMRKRAIETAPNHLKVFSIEKRNQIYDDANKKIGRAEILTLGGIGLLISDVAIYYLRKKRHKKKQEVYLNNCNSNALNFQSIFTVSNVESVTAGFQIGYYF